MKIPLKQGKWQILPPMELLIIPLSTGQNEFSPTSKNQSLSAILWQLSCPLSFLWTKKKPHKRKKSRVIYFQTWNVLPFILFFCGPRVIDINSRGRGQRQQKFLCSTEKQQQPCEPWVPQLKPHSAGGSQFLPDNKNEQDQGEKKKKNESLQNGGGVGVMRRKRRKKAVRSGEGRVPVRTDR